MLRRWPMGRAVVIITLAALGFTSCSNPATSTYAEERVGKIVVDRPTAWSTEIPVEAPWSKGFRAAPNSIEQIQIAGDFGEFVSASQAMGELVGQAQIGLKGFDIVQTRDVEIKGATSGQAVRFTITDNTGSQLAGEWITAAHWPYPQSVAVSILQPQFDPELERQIVESMELKPVLK